ncbi:hypothetical protein [Litorisediminicola beolgyonensis]|uniref:Sulfotransferase family protein n=1 Tax=Litorisediminicola beolgyonensis TaxID=1173614 RepID=A0ABW3ZDC4_9RHOB
MTRYVLHLGAHRTGSTSLQTVLDGLSQEIAPAKVLTPPRPDKRSTATIREVLGDAVRAHRSRNPLTRWTGLRRSRTDLAALTGGADRVILSEEMLLGPAFKRDGRGLYPEADARLRAARALLRDSPERLHLTIRSYASFIVSVYAMRAVFAGNLPPFDQIAQRLCDPEAGWPDLIDVIQRVFPGTPLHIAVLEDTRLEDRVRDLLGDWARIEEIRDPGGVNAAPTTEAIRAALSMSRGAYDPDCLVADHAGGTRFDPLETADKERLSQRYQNDLDRLRRRGDLVWVSRP